MIRIIRLRQAGAAAPPVNERAHHYSIAGQRVVFQTPVETLAAYSEGGATERYSEMLSALTAPPLLNDANSVVHYTGKAPFAGKQREVRCYKVDGYLQFDVEQSPLCSIDFANKQITVLNDAGFDDALNLEVVTGPALMLFLAARGIFSLHGGAVETPVGNILMIAESGIGKSTLSADAGASWRQLADDIIPIRPLGDTKDDGYAIGDYPQLKLKGARPIQMPRQNSKIDLMLRLSNRQVIAAEFRALSKVEALLEIIRHTVAAKLFNDEQMRAHVKLAKRLSAAIPILEVAYPRDLDQISELREKIIDHARSLR